jgi:bifunctional DNA-binding transcriptional regulator/antitoxin component of YhaV-PrlF toxin-antitoxin module
MKDSKIPELIKTSSKGQRVIPSIVRRQLGIRRSSVFAVSAGKDMIVLKKLETGMKPEELRTLKMIEEAWDDIEKGRFRKASPEQFFKELAKWKR